LITSTADASEDAHADLFLVDADTHQALRWAGVSTGRSRTGRLV